MDIRTSQVGAPAFVSLMGASDCFPNMIAPSRQGHRCHVPNRSCAERRRGVTSGMCTQQERSIMCAIFTQWRNFASASARQLVQSHPLLCACCACSRSLPPSHAQQSTQRPKAPSHRDQVMLPHNRPCTHLMCKAVAGLGHMVETHLDDTRKPPFFCDEDVLSTFKSTR